MTIVGTGNIPRVTLHWYIEVHMVDIRISQDVITFVH